MRFFTGDDCVFVDGRSLVRNATGRILWKLLQEHVATGRTPFASTELLLDPSPRLPPVKDTVETRLELLRGRLQERCPWIRVEQVSKGQLELSLTRPMDLVERGRA